MELSVTEKERYARQIVLNGFGLEGQLRLKESIVYVIGAGGLGSSLLLYLAAAGIGKLVIIDGDKVQLNNLQRQIIFNNQQLQKNKAAAAKDILQHLNEHAQVEVIETFIN
ncbi:MAG: ThiF family adenylyltransferase, partial [Bacteroidia bacterium]